MNYIQLSQDNIHISQLLQLRLLEKAGIHNLEG